MKASVVNVIIMGEKKSGKGHLLKFIEDPSTAKFASRSLDVKHVAVHRFNEEFNFWDTVISKPSYRNEPTNALIYCVDLSKDSLDEQKIMANIEQFKVTQPKAAICLVGTKSDIAVNDTLTAFKNLCKNEKIDYSNILSFVPIEKDKEKEEERKQNLSKNFRLTLFELCVGLNSEEEAKRQKLLSDIEVQVQDLLNLHAQVALTSFKVKLDKMQTKFDSRMHPETTEETQNTVCSTLERDRFFSGTTPAPSVEATLDVSLQQSTGSKAPTSSSYQ